MDSRCHLLEIFLCHYSRSCRKMTNINNFISYLIICRPTINYFLHYCPEFHYFTKHISTKFFEFDQSFKFSVMRYVPLLLGSPGDVTTYLKHIKAIINIRPVLSSCPKNPMPRTRGLGLSL